MHTQCKTITTLAGVAAGLTTVAAMGQDNCPEGIFDDGTAYGVGADPNDLEAGDLNNDGHPDLVTANSSDNVSVLFSKGEGAFQPAMHFDAGADPTSVAIGDLNGDNYAGLAVANDGGMSVSVLFNNAKPDAPGFQPAVNIDVAGNPFDIEIGDVNQDGAADIVTAPFTQKVNELSLLLNNGDGTFQPVQMVDAGIGNNLPMALDIGDVDNNDALDFVVVNAGQISVVLGNGDGTFQPPMIVDASAGSTPIEAVLGDINGDDDLDILSTAVGGGGETTVLLGDGDGTFQETGQLFGAYDVAIGQVDGDDNSDIVTAKQTDGQVLLYAGNGDGTFSSEIVLKDTDVPNSEPESLVLEDLGGDGDPDLAVMWPESNEVRVYLNQCTISPIITQHPSTYAVVDAGQSTMFSVDVSEDAMPVTYQWQRNGDPVRNNERISGAQTSTLTINPTKSTDSDSYTVVVMNPKGSVTSDPKVLAVRDSCRPDLDNNGAVAVPDLLQFLGDWGACR